MCIRDRDKGLIDFGIVFGNVDPTKYNSIEFPFKDTWGVLMRRDSSSAAKKTIQPEDLWDKPLIISNQDDSKACLLYTSSGEAMYRGSPPLSPV